MKNKALHIFEFSLLIFFSSCQTKDMKPLHLTIVLNKQVDGIKETDPLPSYFQKLLMPIECDKTVFVPDVKICRLDEKDTMFIVLPSTLQNKLKKFSGTYDYAALLQDYEQCLPELKATDYLTRPGVIDNFSSISLQDGLNYFPENLDEHSTDSIVEIISTTSCSKESDLNSAPITIVYEQQPKVIDSSVIKYSNAIERAKYYSSKGDCHNAIKFAKKALEIREKDSTALKIITDCTPGKINPPPGPSKKHKTCQECSNDSLPFHPFSITYTDKSLSWKDEGNTFLYTLTISDWLSHEVLWSTKTNSESISPPILNSLNSSRYYEFKVIPTNQGSTYKGAHLKFRIDDAKNISDGVCEQLK